MTWNGRSSTTSWNHWSRRLTTRVVWHLLNHLDRVVKKVVIPWIENQLLNDLILKAVLASLWRLWMVHLSRRHLKQSKRVVSMERKQTICHLVDSKIVSLVWELIAMMVNTRGTVPVYMDSKLHWQRVRSNNTSNEKTPRNNLLRIIFVSKHKI